ncbi:hypothetical protein NDU88_009119 [Pleurodeles waltl]|uniref:Uncharacterized protein n=1 Tax=Pleurodeles waltl TaxID=8319 RepID=A0AAV7PRI9_PLEWA|nr:hypothetical protein NDU88_009119 [Pleurodeles waltl]
MTVRLATEQLNCSPLALSYSGWCFGVALPPVAALGLCIIRTTSTGTAIGIAKYSTSFAIKMGRGDPKQKKLSFDPLIGARRLHTLSHSEESPNNNAAVASFDGVAPITAQLSARFKSTDACFHSLTNRLDRLSERIERHAVRLDGTERRNSEMEDDATTVKK